MGTRNKGGGNNVIEIYRQVGYMSKKCIRFAENMETKVILFAYYEGTDTVLTKEEIEGELF
jgi:hypothetical protein